MPYKDNSMKSQRQKERRKGEAPAIIEAPKPLSEAPYTPLSRNVTPCGTPKRIGVTEAGTIIEVDTERAAKLLMVCNSLDKTSSGLVGRENLLDLVRYGVSGPTMRSVKASLA